MSKHTPGPWVVRNHDAVYAQSGRFIADCELTPYGSRPQPPNSTDEANANLIAAAPAMYEALQKISALYLKAAESEGEFFLDEAEIGSLADDAIAQATNNRTSHK